MDSHEEKVQKHVVVNSPGERREILTERVQSGPRQSRISGGTIAIIVVLALSAVIVVLYIINNRNANEAANRNANLSAASQTNNHQPTTIIQQPAQQAPVIIQQPAQPAPVIIQQPNLRDSANDDANMQELATRRLNDEPGMNTVSISINEARAVLTGTVNSLAARTKAEQLVKAVRGVKSVDNQIVVSG